MTVGSDAGAGGPASGTVGTGATAVAELADACADAAGAVRRHECCSVERLATVGELLDAALAEMLRSTSAAPEVAAWQARAADLVVVLAAAGLPTGDRERLAEALADLLSDVAGTLRHGGGQEPLGESQA